MGEGEIPALGRLPEQTQPSPELTTLASKQGNQFNLVCLEFPHFSMESQETQQLPQSQANPGLLVTPPPAKP